MIDGPLIEGEKKLDLDFTFSFNIPFNAGCGFKDGTNALENEGVQLFVDKSKDFFVQGKKEPYFVLTDKDAATKQFFPKDDEPTEECP